MEGKLSIRRRIKRIESYMLGVGYRPYRIEYDIVRQVIKVWEDEHHYLDFDPAQHRDYDIAMFAAWSFTGKGC